MQAVAFTDPAGVLSPYTWPQNPSAVTAAQKARQITRTSNTANVGATRQQGDDGSYIIDWIVPVGGTAHESALWQWYVLCKTQTIFLTDFTGEKFEGQITTLTRQEIPANSGPGDVASRKFYAQYQFQFEVWRFVSGLLHDAGVLT